MRQALLRLGRVITVAPEREQSAGSHAITLTRPLRHRTIAEDVHAVDGTPADCIYVALHHGSLLPRRPDVVVSGINHGPNLGYDVFYSGTVAAAREGAFRQIPAIAFSMGGPGELDGAADLGVTLVERLMEVEPPDEQTILLNVNFPPGKPKGIRATCLGRRHYAEGVVVRQDPRGQDYFWIGGPGGVRHDPVEGSDTGAVDEGYVSVTPLRLQATHPEHMNVAEFVAGPSPEDDA